MFNHNLLSYVTLSAVVLNPKYISKYVYYGWIMPKWIMEKEKTYCSTKRVSVKLIVYKIDKLVSGHWSYCDMTLLLKGNGLWNNAIQHYLWNTVSNCKDCTFSSLPPPSYNFTV